MNNIIQLHTDYRLEDNYGSRPRRPCSFSKGPLPPHTTCINLPKISIKLITHIYIINKLQTQSNL